MTKIESQERLIHHSADRLFNFLSDFNHFEPLMPEKVVNWKATQDTCYFTISGIASLGMKIVEKEPNRRLKMIQDGKVPFDFDFNVYIQEDGDNALVKLILNAKLNAMYKMVAVKPLKHFLNDLLDHLEEIEI